ncbi:MAG: hypothetical protein ACKVHR_18095 [Pirellulales bacterium]
MTLVPEFDDWISIRYFQFILFYLIQTFSIFKDKTMTILRSGTTKKYSDNWDSAFGEKKKTTKAKAAPKTKKVKKKKSSPKK